MESTMTTTGSMITTESMTATVSTTTTESKSSNLLISTLLPVSLVFVFSLLIIIACISFLILYKRRQSIHLSSITKPHKESEENSYASSEHGREFSSKQSASPDPVYDVIKMGHLKEVALKSTEVDNNLKFAFSNKDSPVKGEYLDDDLLYSTICSSDGDSHKIFSSEIDPPSTGECHKRESNNLSDDIHSNSGGNEEIEGAELDDKTNEPHTFSVVHSKARARQSKPENKVLQIANKSPDQKHTFSSDNEAPSTPPHTVEMMYTAVQKRPKDSVEVEDEGDAPPVPPYTGEEYHTEGT